MRPSRCVLLFDVRRSYFSSAQGGKVRCEGMEENGTPRAFDPAAAERPAPGGRFVILSYPVIECERDGGRFSPMLMVEPSGTVGLSCELCGTRCCCCCWSGCCCCGSRRGCCSRCSRSTQNAQKESSPLDTDSFFTDAMRPPRSSLFNSSLALPCPLAGIWINSNGMAFF